MSYPSFSQRPGRGARIRSPLAALFAGMTAAGAIAALLWAAPVEAQETLDFGGTIIEGEVLTPEVTIFISRENLLKDYNIVLEESFLQEIIKSVDRPPF